MKGHYSIFIQGYDWGCNVNRVTLTLEKPVDPKGIQIFETRQINDHDIDTFERTITKTTIHNNSITFDLKVSNQDGNYMFKSLIRPYNVFCSTYYLTFKHPDINLDINPEYEIHSSIDCFDIQPFTFNNVTLQQASYATDSSTLVIWLHGLGEGGKDGKMQLLGNEAAFLSYPSFQKELKCHILAPQCPTYWMDEKGTMENLNGGAIQATKTSYYTEALIHCIQEYKKKHNIKKTILTGCSNGGYMCMLLGIKYPDEFDGILPVCEALPDALITDEDIQTLSRIPMYFYFATNDQLVPPMLHEIPTIQRLKEAGAVNLHASIFDHVEGCKDYLDENGKPYMYSGHRTWIYFYHNISKDEIEPWSWMKTL